MKPLNFCGHKQKLAGRFSALYAALVIIALATSAASAVYAQSFTGSINGAVTDQSGAALANASITLTAGATGQTRITTTNNQGEYSFSSLPPGQYKVRITADGFVAREIIAQLAVSQALRADAQLSVGSTTETVNISESDGVAVETQNAQLSNVVNQRQVAELPLITRNPYDLITLSAG